MYCHIFTYAEAFAVNAYLFKYFKYAKVVSRPTTRHGHLLLTYVYILALGSVIYTDTLVSSPHLLYIIPLLSSNNNSSKFCLGLISAMSFSFCLIFKVQNGEYGGADEPQKPQNFVRPSK